MNRKNKSEPLAPAAPTPRRGAAPANGRAQPSRVVRRAGVCGGDAIISGTRIPVWLVEKATRAGCSKSQIKSMYPALTDDDLSAASKYASEHEEEVERLIRENEEA